MKQPVISKENNEFLSLSKIIENLPVGIFFKSLVGIYKICNYYFLELLEFSNYQQIIHKTDHQLPWAVYADEMQEAEQEPLPLVIPAKAGIAFALAF